MSLSSYRDAEGLTLEQACEALGLRSRGRLSNLERGLETWPLRLALQVEIWTGGKVTAASLVSPDDQQLLKDFAARQAAAADQAAA